MQLTRRAVELIQWAFEHPESGLKVPAFVVGDVPVIVAWAKAALATPAEEAATVKGKKQPGESPKG